MDVRGGSPDTLGDQSPCDVYEFPSRENMPSTHYDLEQVRTEEPDLIADYCALYSEAGRSRIEERERSATPSPVDRSYQIVPVGTVFYCRLDNRTHEVTVTHEDGVFTYRYGPHGQPPELELVRNESEVAVLPEKGMGAMRYGYIAFENGEFRYEASYYYEFIDPDVTRTNSPDLPLDNDRFSRSLGVTEINTGEKIFGRKCLRQAFYDEFPLLKNRH